MKHIFISLAALKEGMISSRYWHAAVLVGAGTGLTSLAVSLDYSCRQIVQLADQVRALSTEDCRFPIALAEYCATACVLAGASLASGLILHASQSELSGQARSLEDALDSKSLKVARHLGSGLCLRR